MALSKPVLYLALVGTVVAAWVVTSDDSAAPTRSTKKKKSKITSSKNAPVWLPEDYRANEDGNRFTLVNEPMRNAFKPLVARKREADVPVNDYGLPVGEPNWTYKGMAEIDGVPMALLENTRTGDGVFLKQGEVWKGITVYRIAPEDLVVRAKDGQTRTVKIDAPQDSMPLGTVPGGLQPMAPPIRGPIGGGLAIQPDGSAVAGRRNRNRNAPGIENTGVGDED